MCDIICNARVHEALLQQHVCFQVALLSSSMYGNSVTITNAHLFRSELQSAVLVIEQCAMRLAARLPAKRERSTFCRSYRSQDCQPGLCCMFSDRSTQTSAC